MSFRRLLLLGVVSIAVGALAASPAAFSSSLTTITCTGTQSTNVPGDLSVPKGKTCTINPGVSIGHDVDVSSGATLVDKGALIGHDIQATSPKGIGIGGSASGPGKVGTDIEISGTTGSASGGNNYLCNTQVGDSVQISGSASSAGQWIVGDIDESCSGGGNQVGNDVQVMNNKVRVDVSDNEEGTFPYTVGIGDDLEVTGNVVTKTSPVVESNFIGNNAECQAGTKQDGDGTPNTVGGVNEGCP